VSYEIEIKCLLGHKDRADSLRERLVEVDPDSKLVRSGSQLNHYFEGGEISFLARKMSDYLSEGQQNEVNKLASEGHDFSVRTRQADDDVILVIKASIDDTTSANGIARREFEAIVDMTLDELDRVLLAAGYTYQAKWSRDREEYSCRDANICVDRNAGYGYVAELEKVVDEEEHAASARDELRGLLGELGLEELPQDRLERMFAHYNKHWPEYYGTTNIFVVE
jgi:adenylate cyclase class IV